LGELYHVKCQHYLGCAFSHSGFNRREYGSQVDKGGMPMSQRSDLFFESTPWLFVNRSLFFSLQKEAQQ
jgi:hypothetical protein